MEHAIKWLTIIIWLCVSGLVLEVLKLWVR